MSASEGSSPAMKLAHLIRLVAMLLLSSCSSPTVVVQFSGLRQADLRNKIIAVGGLSADLMTYPGQVPEMKILCEAGRAMQCRLKRSRVLGPEETWAVTGPPVTRHAIPVPVVLGRELTSRYIDKARSRGIDYLLWIDLVGNSVAFSSGSSQHFKSPSSSSCSRSSTRNRNSRGTTFTNQRVIVYSIYESAARSVHAVYSLLDTRTGKPVWQAGASDSDSTTHSRSSESGYPAPLTRPLPKEEPELMRPMTVAVINELPR